MSESLYGLLEMLLFFGILLAFLIWQLIVTRRSIREDRERAPREASESAITPVGSPDRIDNNRKNR